MNLSAILEDHTQRELHPEWAAPAVLEDCGLESPGLTPEPDMCHRFEPRHRRRCETASHFGRTDSARDVDLMGNQCPV